MQSVSIIVATERTVASNHDVLSIGRSFDRANTVLLQQRGIIAGCQLESFCIQDRNVGIKKVTVDTLEKSHALDFRGQTFTLL